LPNRTGVLPLGARGSIFLVSDDVSSRDGKL
jgi:hypothetical protein